MRILEAVIPTGDTMVGGGRESAQARGIGEAETRHRRS